MLSFRTRDLLISKTAFGSMQTMYSESMTDNPGKSIQEARHWVNYLMAPNN